MINETNDITKGRDIDALLKEILLHHMDSFYNNDVDALISDYTNESFIITLHKTFRGLKEIRFFLNELIGFFPKDETILVLDKISIEDEIGYVVWHAKTPSLEISLGSGTYIIKKGKIVQQTFVGQIDKKTM